jgi:hypothetical protein
MLLANPFSLSSMVLQICPYQRTIAAAQHQLGGNQQQLALPQQPPAFEG